MSVALELPELESATRIDGARVGCLRHLDSEGQPVVDFEGCPFGLIRARLALPGVDLEQLADVQAGVVLVFEHGDPLRPIIVGVLQDVMPPPPPTAPAAEP